MIHELQELKVGSIQLKSPGQARSWPTFGQKSSLVERVKELQRDYLELSKLMGNLKIGQVQGFSVVERDVLWFEIRLCV